ncbi:MAG TPA: ABC transporter ATP-binding protein [Steroidobacteraceae bacterium]|nr:ABC transporter ATP-binding protein [Steroidobacteraceae bacterium]
MSEAMLLGTAKLYVQAGDRRLIEALSMTVAAGEFIAVLGRNGSGKSLMLHTLAGLREPAAGHVTLGERPLATLRRRAIAQQLGLLPQDFEESLGLTALEAAVTARHPHLGLLGREGAADRQIAEAALSRFGVAEHARRILTSLSGGEQRRAAMACLLAQNPRIYLLDEPTNHLDPHHQLEVLRIFRGLCAEGAAVIATLHDPALADRFADRILLLYGDGRWRLGQTAELLNAAELSALYLTPISELRDGGRRAFIPA